MKIIADDNIPLVTHFFPENEHVIVYKSGREITRHDVLDANILLVRSVTKVDHSLLHNTAIQFVGSCTTGTDHLDTQWLHSQGIQWASAKGCNTSTVVEYVFSVISTLQMNNLLKHKSPRAAVIGVGAIGSLVARKLIDLGFEVILCDPVRALTEPEFFHTSLQEISHVDLITLHTPLTFSGKFPTFHMIDAEFLKKQKSGCILLNTSRGSVIDFSDLKRAGTHLHWCLDVWENEPHIDLDILSKSLIATPHIAGYSMQSKHRGIEMIYQHLVKIGMIADKRSFPEKYNFAKTPSDHFDPIKTTEKMKSSLLNRRITFDDLRKMST